ncbi:MAG: hypothetical protein DWQ56_16045 [Microcystis aeruginosa DA14]|uniref:Uncharacterized protein n=1 Tax=Microcystis aeruginosa DA14 TaxID=1987506 RepID=A0A3E0M823_MICAE|nr:MAG: hypothetical protein DWQ56_16045 [Microcystis aeruginosa DA14]
MTWRGSTDTKDRIFAALVYLLPLYSAFAFGIFIFQQIPFLKEALEIVLTPLAFLYSSLGSFGSLIIFFVLFLAVVRNPRISHFIRFNTMQAILIDILVSLLRLVLDFVARGGANLVVETLFNVVFLGAFAACVYSIIQSFIGKYADIPTISEAAYSQVGG